MFKLIGLWYRSKVLKYQAMMSSVDEMHERSEKLGLGGLTLTELGQLHYMGTEMITLAQVAEVAAKAGKVVAEAGKNKNDEAVELTLDDDDEHHNTGQYL
jgi:hypothetical protein